MARELGLADPRSLPLVLLPANRTASNRLSEKRKRRFRAHLERVVAEAFASPRLPEAALCEETTPASHDLEWIAKACGTCRGRCCHAGGEHAFVDIATVHRYLRAHPEADPEGVVEDYFGRLAERPYEGSCVFHGEEGCELPRSMRAAICNQFLCSPLGEGRAPIEAGSPTRVLLAALHGERLIRSQLIEASSASPDQASEAKARLPRK